MSIIRTSHDKNRPYVILNKQALEDPDLSWEAKGLWAYLMSRPDDWTVSVEHLCKIYKMRGGGRDSIYKILNELIKHGYCTRVQEQGVNGKFEKYEYIISELKNKVPLPDLPLPDLPLPVNPTLLSNESIPSKEKKYIQIDKKLKIKFGDYFECTQEDHEKLIELHGESLVKEIIEDINNYCANSRPKGYTNSIAAFNTFVKRQKKQSSGTKKPGRNVIGGSDNEEYNHVF